MIFDNPASTPVAKVFSPLELRGWLKKSVAIPPGKTGIALYRNGKTRTLTPGKTLLLNPFTRLRGDGIGMLVGYVPSDPFKLAARYENLLTGDDELLDVNLLLEVRVIDPAIFFSSVVVPVGEVIELPDFGSQPIHDSLERVVSQYEREDILRRIPSDRLSSEVRAAIQPGMSGFGLELHSIFHLFFKRSEDRLVTEEKLAALESRVGQPEAAAREGEQPGSQLLDDSGRLLSNEKRPLADLIDDIHTFRRLERSPRAHWIFRSIQEPKMDGLSEQEKTTIRKYRGLEFRWAFFFLLIGAGITYLLFRSKLDLNSTEMIAFLTGTWASMISLILARLKKVVEKQENLFYESNTRGTKDAPRFIATEEKQGVEKLVRQQCAGEVQHTRELMNSAREDVFRNGNAELALRIKELEKRLETQKEKIINTSSYVPYYLADTPIRESEWKKILDREEEILLQAKSLGRMAEKFRSLAPNVQTVDLEKLENQSRQLEDLLYARSRIV